MPFPLVGAPPPLRSCGLSWRQLYEAGCFFQRDLESDSDLGRASQKRGLTLTPVGADKWEQWDRLGTLRPVAFAREPYVSGDRAPALPSDAVVFRDECTQYEPWEETYAWDAWGHPHVSALYTPWQILVLPDVIEGGTVAVPLEMLIDDAPIEWGEAPKTFFRAKYDQWTHLPEWWDPTLRLLVRLQNRYWPPVLGRVRVASGPDGTWEDPEALAEFDAAAVLTELEVSTEDMVETYRHLARRGYELEFGDSAYLLRQVMPRGRRRDFEKRARRAQDFYDAAEMVRRFYRDLTGETLPDAEVMARAHSDEELRILGEHREKLLGHGPSLSYDAEDAKRVLHALGVYPHGIHVIVEGESEELLVNGLGEDLLGLRAVDDLVVTNLRGVGGATRIEKLLAAVSDYALRAVLVVDNEGDMKKHVDRLIADGQLDAEDVLVQDKSLEESNFTDDELVSIAIELAAVPTDKRPAATLELTSTQLREYHDDRLTRSSGKDKDKPGLADSLATLAGRQEHGAVRFSKPELAKAIRQRLVAELSATSNWEELEEAAARRPVLNHIVQRVTKPLAEAPVDAPQRRRGQ